ncbi:glycosyltransferase [Pedobacter sp. MW01-1-1]|uniref:glycosyltransferase n=1 Tax=Pedobacter sp. MW01-1-1 TaxID=3383027 RepID=UPI003FEE1E22
MIVLDNLNLTKEDFISIIIPVYNNLERLKRCIRCIRIQDYPLEQLEVIVVDNGSKKIKSIKKFLTDYDFVKLFEYTASKSPYPCRNIGINEAKGNIIALLDSNCFPVQNWLKEGLKMLKNNHLDLVAGRVVFEFSDNYTVSEIADSLIFVNVENSVKTGGLPGGNAFIRAEVFDTVGLFDEKLRSSGDAIWSKRATRQGFKVGYSDTAISFYPAKQFFPFIRKSFRIGFGSLHFWKLEGYPKYKIRKMHMDNLRPIKMIQIKKLIVHKGELDMFDRIMQIWLCLWVANLMRFIGRSYAMIISPK